MLFHKLGKLEQFSKEANTLRTVNIWLGILYFKEQFFFLNSYQEK